jgi:hypothetical protein
MSERHTDDDLPDNHVVAVISGEDAAKEAAKELRAAGFGDTSLIEGDEATNAFDAKGERSGPIAKVIKAVQDHLSEEPNYLAQYQEEARSGHEIVAVKVDDHDQAETAKLILKRHGARNIRYFGKLAVTDLSPETNPTTRSADSPERRS